jgi:hypothetical protein
MCNNILKEIKDGFIHVQTLTFNLYLASFFGKCLYPVR